jgi:hypothetical protein
MVASSSALLRPTELAKGSAIEPDWSTRNKKHVGFERLISAW